MKKYVQIGSNFCTEADNISTITYSRVAESRMWRFIVNAKSAENKLAPLWVAELKSEEEAKLLYESIIKQLEFVAFKP